LVLTEIEIEYKVRQVNPQSLNVLRI
jgi:hypothetical protein